jgi:hypothetical protein
VENLNYLPAKELAKKVEDSGKTFEAALAAGRKNIFGYARILQSGENPQFGFISIENARKKGIMPIPFTMDK